ncbi:acetoacetate--CoA ligase [Candidatus Poriferisocius sp.]|uniref:acetoacetate--CoA ligase n=1 Tax=Candidatus Poriferisocius sp. TaxID=3101276 RepID=UPI003B52226E
MSQTPAIADDVVWRPPPDAWANSRMGQFAERYQPAALGDYEALWRWSVEEPGDFWASVWDYLEIDATQAPRSVISGSPMPNTTWFDGATLNYAEHILRGNGLSDTDVAAVGRSQTRPAQELSLGELREEVRRAAAGLRRLGVGPGDRVVALLPNIPETLVAFLATASIGAVWASCAPEFGARGVLDRWTQVQPKVLLAVDGYRYGAKPIDISGVIDQIRRGLPSVQSTVLLPYLDPDATISKDVQTWSDLTADTTEPLRFEPVPFAHPLYILSSSGTTGRPKQIVHGHGGILLEHGKQLALHHDLGPGDRFFWFSTTGWMMWNYLMSGLLAGASIVMFDGDPASPTLDTLWSIVEQSAVTLAGFSAPFLMACRSAGLRPGETLDLRRLREIGSTGAPLPDAGYRWISEAVAPMPVSNISGGTDVCSAFVGGAPVLPVRSGAIACRQLGWRVDAFDPDGQPLREIDGELVITGPAPSMPVGLWGDEDRRRYRGSYFESFDGVWSHGDWITIFDDGSCVISGRSDATLNRGGVRLGTADFYSVIEEHDLVDDSLVVHLEDDEGGLGDLLAFVVLRDGQELTEELREWLRTRLRAELSPRHVPDEIRSAPVIPRTISGKKLEVPVKRILLGAAASQVASASALQDPNSLHYFEAFGQRWRDNAHGRTA